jgi:hypothetical protein
MRISASVRVLTLMVAVVMLVSACGGQNVTKDTSAASLLPNLPDYTVNNVLNIQDAIAKVAGATSLGAAQPQITAVIAAANTLATCYQAAGGVEGRTYVNNADPFKAGLVVIANRNVLANPQTFLSCVSPSMGAKSLVPQVEPCAKAYVLPKDNNEFYIAYVATNPEVCAALCSSLQGCTP